MLSKDKIQVNPANLNDGDSVAAYLTSASAALITSETIGANEHVHTKGPESHVDGSAYAATVDYLSSIGVVDSNGNWVPFTLNADGELPVSASVDMEGDYPEDSPHTSGDRGLFNLSVRRDTRTSGTSADGDYASFNTNANGELYVHDQDALVQLNDANDSLDAIEASVAGIDSNVSLIYAEQLDQGITLDSILADTATIDSQTLSIANTLTALSKAEDAVHSTGDTGIQALAVRKDAQGSNAGTDGDYTSLQTWSEGSLKVVNVANSSVSSVAVSVDTTVGGVALGTPLANRKKVIIENLGGQAIYVGPSGVTAASGLRLSANSVLELDVGPACALFAITSAASSDVRIFQAA